MEEIQLGKYKHYKGNEYELIAIATHSETLEKLAVYKQLYGEMGIWVRPLQMFLETILVDGVEVRRFEFLNNRTTERNLNN